MSARCWFVLGVSALTFLSIRAEPPGKSEPDRAARLGRLAWAYTDVVLANHIEPPARQQMLLDGLRAFYRITRQTVPDDLASRVSAVTTERQLTDLIAAALPKAAPDGQSVEDILLAMFSREAERHGEGYLSPERLKAHQVLEGNRYVGTGIQIRHDPKEDLAQIVVPFPGGPARRAGARPGDLIVSVDGVDMKGRPLREVVKRIGGNEGAPVTVVVRQPGDKETRALKMVRDVIPFNSVMGFRRTGEESWSYRPDAAAPVGYVRIEEIKASTASELVKVEGKVREQGVKALVLDLRFTRGTDVGHAARLADDLLDGGTLWRTRDAHSRQKEYKADRDCVFRGMPVVVLVGPQTGRMGEAVAAALGDNGRAVVVGEATRGDLVVTSLIPLGEGQGAALLPTGRIERVAQRKAPRAEEDQEGPAVGIAPVHRVKMPSEAQERLFEWFRVNESPEPDPKAVPPQDPQLAKAIEVLQKALEKSGARKDG